MPRIRKKTSNRQTIHDRRKIQRKVRESRKKAKKEAKRNPQWKSRKQKNQAIPNNFPFKDQILAEISEARRTASGSKCRQKDSRDTQFDIDDFSSACGPKPLNSGIESNVLAEENVEAVLDPINPNLPTMLAVLDKADAVIQVLDARDPLPFRSSHLENLASDKHIILLLNKIDTCPRESVSAWLTYLRAQLPTFLFRSATTFLPSKRTCTLPSKERGKTTSSTDDAGDGFGVDSVLMCLSEWANSKDDDVPLTVAVIGVTNAGKSSVINTLIRKAVLPVYAQESSKGATTKSPKEVIIKVENHTVRIIDTPGLSWQAPESAAELDNHRIHDILLWSKGRIDYLKDPIAAVANIISRSSVQDLMLLHSMPTFTRDDVNSFLSGVARSNKLVKKHGILDIFGASRLVLRDWSSGKFARYTLPSSSPSPATSSSDSNTLVHAEDAKVLEKLMPRKEMQRTKRLVRLVPGNIEMRNAILDKSWVDEIGLENRSNHTDHDSECLRVGSNARGSPNVEDEETRYDDSDAEEIEGESPFRSQPEKQKRKLATDSAFSSQKRVAFKDGPPTEITGSRSRMRKSMSNPRTKTVPTHPRERKVANMSAKGKDISGEGSNTAYDFSKFF